VNFPGSAFTQLGKGSRVIKMSLAKKMFVPEGVLVPCVGLPVEIDLGDIHPWSGSIKNAKQMVLEGKSPSLFVFVENSNQLSKLNEELKIMWEQKITFWVFYPKKPHLNTDLGRDIVWEKLKQIGLSGTRQVGIDNNWSCLYYKAK
jgi:hypothetical protein